MTSKSQTLIDHIYVTNPNHILETNIPYTNYSDHYPICLTWSKKGTKIPKSGHKTISYRCFSNFKEDLFLNDLNESEINNVYNITDPEEAFTFWLNSFKKIYNKHAPFKSKRIKHYKKPLWLTTEIQNACHLRDNLKAKGQHEMSNRLRNQINSLKRKAKKKYFQTLLSNTNNTKLIWKSINELTNKQPKSNTKIINISAEVLNNHFSNIARKTILTDLSKSNNLEKLQEFCEQRNIKSLSSIPPLTIFEVYAYLTHLKQSKTYGLDELDGNILKIAAPIITNSLTYLYNLCIDKNYFPVILKQARVIPIHKSGDNSDPSNYRPISILPILSKPLEKHINKHLVKHLDINNLIYPNQSGFRKKHSCHTSLIHLVDHWLEKINRNEFCGALFIDFKKAFDVIDHNLLLRKLSCYGISQNTQTLLKSFLTDRQQCIKMNKSTSTLQTLYYGVPQGSILGPVLFSLYINDLPLHLKVNTEIFADDTTIHTHNKCLKQLTQDIQESVDNLKNWTDYNHMALHPQKTKYMIITTRQKRQNFPLKIPSIHLNNQNIEEVNYHKVLGVTIDNNLSWSNHISNLCKIASSKLYQFSKIKHFLDLNSRKLFFQSNIQSLFDYASSLWDNASKNILKPLHSIHRRAIKHILLKSSTLSKEDYIKIDILPFYDRLHYNKCVLMYKIMMGLSPNYLYNIFSINNIRNNNKINTPSPRLDLYKSSLNYSGSLCWNSLPIDLKIGITYSLFKKKLHEHLTNT